MALFNLSPQSRVLWTALDDTLHGEAIQAADGWWTSSVANADGACLPIAGERRETVESATAFAIAAALDSDLVDPLDSPYLAPTTLDLVEAVTAFRGSYENTGGGTMCATWDKDGITAVIGNDGATVGLYRSSVWYGDEEGEHFAVVDGCDDSFTDALRAVVRFLEWA